MESEYIRWNSSEWNELKKYLVEIVGLQRYESYEFNRHEIDSAQKQALEENRLRTITNKVAFRIREQLRERDEFASKEWKPAAPKTVAPAPTIITDALESIIERIADRVVQKLNEQKGAAGAAIVTLPFIKPPQEERRKKTVIGIIGPKPNQQEDLRKEFARFTLEFVEDCSIGGHKAVQRLHSAAIVIGMIDFINHSIEPPVVAHFKKNYYRVNGGVSSIKRKIWALYNMGAIV